MCENNLNNLEKAQCQIKNSEKMLKAIFYLIGFQYHKQNSLTFTIEELDKIQNLLKSIINVRNLEKIELYNWLLDIDIIDSASLEDEKNKEEFFKIMFSVKWFPSIIWVVPLKIIDEILEILNTSRASKNRIKRIDKLIFSYYDKDKINNLKRGWRNMHLPSYMKRILVQSIQAYHRREYALTVSALSTLWEGIIQEKVNDNSYRVSKRTRENLTKLIEENEFDNIFSSFCEEFIFYDCKKAEEVKPDVPGRHGIAHCWYNTYPNRKVALNAILFTDFLLGLKPLDKTEEKDNG